MSLQSIMLTFIKVFHEVFTNHQVIFRFIVFVDFFMLGMLQFIFGVFLIIEVLID